MNFSVALSSITDTFLNDDLLGDEDDFKISAPKIYGRDREQVILLKAYREVVESGKRQVVLIHGCSGAGKTAMVEQFRESLCETDEGHFCVGKYFQNAGVQEPYSALMAAFSDLCDLVSQGDDFDEERKTEIRRQLGPEVDVLKMLISNISQFLDTDDGCQFPLNEADLAPDDTSSLFRLKIACKVFLHTMSKSKPLVVFLDDIQWIDKGSKYLVENLLNDGELKNIMFLLAFRDEEVNAVDVALANVNKDSFVDIHVKNMDTEGVTAMLAGALQTPAIGEVIHLAELVAKRTHGNPFHVMQFIDLIQREGLLTFDSDSEMWEFNVAEIQRDIMATDTLTDLLLRMVNLLPSDEQETLKIAALLGYEFESAILFQIARVEEKYRSMEFRSSSMSTCSTSTVSLSLTHALKLGIVEKRGDIFFQFSHDKLQSTFHAMVDSSEEQRLHHMIGEVFAQHNAEGSIFHAAVHLNNAHDLIKDKDDRLRLARLNLQASKFCKSRSAFDNAALLLRQGLDLLEEEDKWSSNFHLAFEMTELLARMELTIGNLESCKLLVRETLRRATSVEMKMKSLLIDVECHMACNEMKSVIANAFSALVTLGIIMPRKVSPVAVLFKLLKVRNKLRRKTDEDILELPIMENQAMVTATRILVNVSIYSLLQDDEFTGAYASLVAAEITLQYGLSPHSASALIVYATSELTFGRFLTAYRFGRLAIKMVDLLKFKDTECTAITLWTTLLGHWEVTIKDLRFQIQRAVEVGFEVGDTSFTGMAIANSFGIAYLNGDNLFELEQFMRRSYNQLCDLSTDSMLLWAQPPMQIVMNQLSEEGSSWTGVAELSGEFMNENEYFRKAAEQEQPIIKIIALTYKASVATTFGLYELSEDVYKNMTNIGKAFFNNFGAMAWYFYGSLTYYNLYQKYHKRHHMKKGRKLHRILEQIEARGSPNVFYVNILRAEWMGMQKSSSLERTTLAFEEAISAMKELKFVQFEALAYERAALFFVKRGNLTKAKMYFDLALDAFENGWGSRIKADFIRAHMATVFVDSTNNAHSKLLVGEDVFIQL